MSTTIFFFQNPNFSEFEIRIFSDEGHNFNYVIMWPWLVWRAIREKKSGGEIEIFVVSWILLFFGFGIFYFYKIGQELKIVFF